MNTPIYDFVTRYNSLRPARFHMPGHKGRGPLGCEELDITEIPGADSLYEADGVIARSEANASALFGCPTFYSTEGSSHCIRAMLLLAAQATGNRHQASGIRHQASGDGGCGSFDSAALRSGRQRTERFRVLAARNCHRAFLSAAALLDLDVVWLPAGDESYLSAAVTPAALDAALGETGAGAVYLTCPDYLGFLPDLGPLAEVCHAHGALLLVDNAHGAYLRFLSPSRHPMDLGADLCCDSAHKTLPVLTGGAYLHLSQRFLEATGEKDCVGSGAQCAPRDALALFGSTSPSYLILQSLDLANPWLETLPEKLSESLPKVEALKTRLTKAGWTLTGNEPLKLTLALDLTGTCGACPPSGIALAAALKQEGIFCEFADPDYVVFMLSPQNSDEELSRLEAALSAVGAHSVRPQTTTHLVGAHSVRPQSPACTLRTALLSPAETIPAAESLGRVLARPGVSCPPAVPIRMPGEVIDKDAIKAFARYGIEEVSVLL